MSDQSRRLRTDDRSNHLSSAEITKRRSSGVRHFSPEEIAHMQNDPTKPIAPTPPPARTAAELVDALLRLVNQQVTNLERAGTLNPAQLGQLSTIASTLTSLINAQRTLAKADEPTTKPASEMTDEELDAALEAARRRKK